MKEKTAMPEFVAKSVKQEREEQKFETRAEVKRLTGFRSLW